MPNNIESGRHQCFPALDRIPEAHQGRQVECPVSAISLCRAAEHYWATASCRISHGTTRRPQASCSTPPYTGGTRSESLIESDGCSDLGDACKSEAARVWGPSKTRVHSPGAQSMSRGARGRCRKSLEGQNAQVPANRPLLRILAQSRESKSLAGLS